MEFAVLFILSLGVAVVRAPHTHHPDPPKPLVCFGDICDEGPKQLCHIHEDPHGFHSKCANEHECHRWCGSPSEKDGCCCYEQSCVGMISNTSVNTQSAQLQSAILTCPDCHDHKHCDMVRHRCHHDEVCMFKEHKDGRTESRCIRNEECLHFQRDSMKHHDEYTTCCRDNNCTHSIQHHHTTGHSGSLHCTTCRDLLNHDCSGDHTCHDDEVCMINHHPDGRVESKCTKIDDCLHHMREGIIDPNKLAVCCTDLQCAMSAMKQTHQVNTATTISTIGSTKLGNTAATPINPIGTTCGDKEDNTFKCADYVRQYDICNKVNGTGLALATTRCQKTCGLCTAVPQTTSPSATNAPVFTNPVIIVTQAPVQTTTKVRTTTKAPTTPTQIHTTTAQPTNPPCVDNDIKNTCQAYQFYFCSPTSGAEARRFAVANCAKTCNLCNEYFAYLQNVPTVHQTQTTTKAPTTLING